MKNSFNIIAKPIGAICNINCQYCFYLEKEKLYPSENNWIMTDEVLEKFTRQYIEHQNSETINFVWQGGEPGLAGIDFYKKAVQYQKKYANEKKIENSFQTNGIFLDDTWCKFFADNNFLVGISIDGPKNLNDKYRIDRKGNSTFDAVIKGINSLLKYSVDFNTLTVVSRTNSYHPLEVYNFLKEVGSKFIQFIPAVEKINTKNSKYNSYLDLPVTGWSIEPLQYGNFLCEIFDEWIKKDVGEYFIQTFDVALERWCNMPSSLCIFAETCGDALAIEHNGDLYSCDHFVNQENLLGNIKNQPMSSLINSDHQIKFGCDKNELLPNYCKQCEFKFACNGGCPKDRFIKSPEGEDGLNYLCQGYKKFFSHISPSMNFMKNELAHTQPPSNVMRWFSTED